MKFELDNVELSYDGRKILYGVYIRTETGKITGLLGSNGCGKSSLLHIFFGNLNCNNKLVRISNKGRLKPLYTTGLVKILSQTDFLPKKMKVGKLFKISEIPFEEFADKFPELTKVKTQRIQELSGGQKRLISIWYVLKAASSKLVLLDEPFTHLSPVYIEKIKEEIVTMKSEKAILLTDHLYKELMEISDDLYFLKKGCTKLISNEKEGYF